MDLGRVLPYVKGDVPDDEPVADIAVLPSEEPVRRELCAGLHVNYLVDEGEHFSYVQRATLEEAGMSADDLHKTALANLDALCGESLEVVSHGDLLVATLDGNLESSLLLSDYLWDVSLVDYIGEQPIAAVPARDVIAMCAHDSASGIENLRAAIERIWPDGDHLVSKSLFVRRNGAWEPHA